MVTADFADFRRLLKNTVFRSQSLEVRKELRGLQNQERDRPGRTYLTAGETPAIPATNLI